MDIKNLQSGPTVHPSTIAQGDAKHHRHFLAFPLFAFLLAALVLTGSTKLQASMLSDSAAAGEILARGGDRVFTLPRGIAGIVREDGSVHDDGNVLTLADGTLLLASDGLVEVQIGPASVKAFDGGFLVTTNGTKFSVHAVTTPVLLAHGDFRLVIPAGMQSQWMNADIPSLFDLGIVAQERDRMRRIDDVVAREELQDLSSLPAAPLPPWEAASAFSPFLRTLALPAAQERLTREETASRLSQLCALLEAGNAEDVHARLRERELQEILSSPDLPTDLLMTLLASARTLPSAQERLLQYVTDNDFWSLLSFHPLYRSAAWETSGPLTIPANARLLRWLQLPSSDVADAIAPRVIDQWQREVTLYVRSIPDSVEFQESLLQSLRGFRSFLEEQEYPERLRRYARAVQEIIGSQSQALSADAQVLYARWNDVDAIAPYSEAPPRIAEEVSPAPVIAPVEEADVPQEEFDAVAVQKQAKNLLLGTSALFTTQTSLEATSATLVKVSGLLFATSTGEHSYDFTLNLTSGEVTEILRDGEPMPYALSLEGLVSWAGSDDGGRPKDRYLLFHIPIKLEKKVHFVDNGRFRKGYEKVVVRERDMSSGERRYWDAEVLAR